MSELNPVRLLPTYTSTESPRPIEIHFSENDDLDLTGATLEFRMEEEDGTEITFTGDLEWADESLGIATLTFAEADLTLDAGVEFALRKGQAWALSSTNRIATVLLLIPIRRAVGTPP